MVSHTAIVMFDGRSSYGDRADGHHRVTPTTPSSEAFCGRMQPKLLDRRRWTTRVELTNTALRDWRSSTTGNDATAR